MINIWSKLCPTAAALIRVLVILVIFSSLMLASVSRVEARPFPFSRLRSSVAASAGSWDAYSGVSFDPATNRIVIGTGGYLKKTFYGRQFRMGLLGASGQPQSLVLNINGHTTTCTSSYAYYVDCNSYIMPTDGWYTVTVSKAGDGAFAWGVGSSATGWLYYEIWGEGDTTPPVQTVSYSTTNWTNGDVTVTLGASDPESGLNTNQYRFMPDSSGVWGAWINCGAGTCAALIAENGQIEHYSSNRLGGVSRTYPRVDNIDKIAPSAINPADVSGPAAFPHDTWVRSGGSAAWDWPDASDTGSGLEVYRIYWGSDPAGTNAVTQANSDYSAAISTDGIYYLRAQTVDLTGNTSVWTDLYTVRLDGTDPVSLPTTNGSTAWDSSTWFNTDTTLGLLTTDNLSGVTLSQFRIDGGPWISSAAMTMDGVYHLEYQAEDVAGNAISGTRIFQLDKTSPLLSSTIPPVDGSNGWYINPPLIAVSGSDTLSGLAAGEISLDNGASWGPTPQLLTDGIYSVVLSTRDLAGNSTAENRVIKVDTTAPSFSTSHNGTPGIAGWYTSDTTINHTYTDNLSGLVLAQMNINSGGWQPIMDQTFSDGVYTIEYFLQDEAGNRTSVIETLRVDTIPPAYNITIPATNGNNGWHRIEPTIQITGVDSGSGVETAEISLDNGASWIPTTTTLSDGMHDVTFRVTDVAGNQSQETRMIKVDTTDPIITETITGTHGSGGWYTSEVTVDAVTSDSGSGLIGEEMHVDGGAWTAIGSVTLTDGSHTVEYRVEDEASNITTKTMAINVDTTAPTASISLTGILGANGWYTSDVRLDLVSSDADSGVAQVEYQTGSLWHPYTGEITLTHGIFDVHFRVTDTAGNTFLTVPVTYRVDTLLPEMEWVLNGSINPPGWSNSPVELVGNAADDGSGLHSFEVNINGTGWVDAASTDLMISNEGVYEILTRAVDLAGNTVADTIDVWVDTTPLVSRFTSPPEGTSVTVTDGTITLVGISTDNLSGVRSTQISLDSGLTWLSLGKTSGWSYTWDTTTIPNGIYPVLVRSLDWADNDSSATQVTVNVDNEKPTIEAPDSESSILDESDTFFQAGLVAANIREKVIAETTNAQIPDDIIQDTAEFSETEGNPGYSEQVNSGSTSKPEMGTPQSADDITQSQHAARTWMSLLGLLLILGVLLVFAIKVRRRAVEDQEGNDQPLDY
jgi:hypothetical protein